MQRSWWRHTSIGVATLALCLTTGPLVAAQEVADDQGGTLSIAWDSGIDRLDPALGYDWISWPAERLLYDTLITYDEGTTLIPHLAADMPAISEDGLTFTFTLRPDVPFVRDGEIVRTMTADDVVFSINRLLRPDLTPFPSPIGEKYFGGIAGADAVLAGEAETASGLVAVDPVTVQITLTQPDRVFLFSLAMPFGSIIPAESGHDADSFEADPVGTGPYYLDDYTVGELAVFQRNPHYWAAGVPKADTIELRLLVPAETQVLQASANELDITGDPIPAADWPIVTTDPELSERVVQTEIMQFTYVTMDTSGPESPFTDPLVRQAVAHAIDKANLVRLNAGLASTAGCLFSPTMPGFDPTCDPYPYDVERARALMAEAGNTGFTTQLYTDDSEVSRQTGESIVADLAQIGITVDLILQDFDTLIGTVVTPHAAPMVSIGWFADFPDPSNFIDPILSCATAVEGAFNLSWYCNEAVDTAAAAARQVLDLGEAIPLYQDIERQIMADAPLVPLLHPIQTGLRSERIPTFQELHPIWFWDLALIPVVE